MNGIGSFPFPMVPHHPGTQVPPRLQSCYAELEHKVISVLDMTHETVKAEQSHLTNEQLHPTF